MSVDVKYMEEALQLASSARGFTKTNPVVGAVCVKNGVVVGKGCHERYGQAHAEVNALNAAGENAKGSTLYVTLEPCNHFGKTPPCTRKILECGVKKVVVAMDDPNPGVEGGGNSFLVKNGVEVETGILNEKAVALNLPFIKYITEKTPYTVLKIAMTLDGKIATKTGDSKWITNEKSRHWVHNLRHQCDAILVGRKTVESDNPSLTARLKNQETSDPVRIILDSKLSLNPKSGLTVFDNKMKNKTKIACCDFVDKNRLSLFKDNGIDVIIVPPDENMQVDISALMYELGKLKISSLMIEGGSVVAGSFLNKSLIDQAAFFYGPKLLACDNSFGALKGNGPEKMKDALEFTNIRTSMFDNDVLIEGRSSQGWNYNRNLLWPVFS